MKILSVFCCFLYAMWTEGAEINVEEFEGGEVSFQCSHKLAWNNNKYLCNNPCSVNEDKLVTVRPGRREESGRITLVDSGNGVFTVTIRQLQLSDSGIYLCAVDRPGFDTFTSVNLTVKEAVATVIPELSSTWTYGKISNSTELTPGMDTSSPTNLSTASNHTNVGEQITSTDTVLYASVGAAAVLTILVLAMCFRKRREISKPQPQVCSNSKDLISAAEREDDCEYDDIAGEVRPIKIVSEQFSCTDHSKHDVPTSASTEAECNIPLHIYENICCSRHNADSRYSAANVQVKHQASSRIYIKPLPSTISERSGDSCCEKHTKNPTATRNAKSKLTRSRTSKASPSHSMSCIDSTDVRPRSLWFGLDLSETL